jgi:SAM-dependent methyltransferase
VDAPGQLFGEVAHTYDRYRPLVPGPGVDWLTEGLDGEVLDLGAGTGQFTTQLLALHRFARVHAVEPDLRMLTQLHRNCPDALASHGTAEVIPLAAASVDAVFVVGAWHWFDTAAALADITRVLRPQGTVAVAWNVRDRAVPWIARVDDIIRRRHAPGHEPGTLVLPGDAPFSSPEQFAISWEWAVRREDFVLSLGTYSHVLALPPQERAEVLSAVDRFLTEHSALVEDGIVQVPIRTECYRTRLLMSR